ncbi:histidine kinase dimerization/phosphoacceptor domain -containing protein [Methylocystis sp. JAN1]|uniref:histidine kinase dimerization/phosphoacceptor domain -containing protein n=1 Tax=Methylocystis sp. JAN1 TaxID=3397211 RepID=UPI003FA313FE
MPWVRQLSKLSQPKRALHSAGITLALFAASLSIRFLFSPVLVGMKFLTFYPAIAVATLLCGWRHGLVMLTLGCLSGWYFFMEPLNSFMIKDASTVGSIIGFLLVGGFEVVIVAALRETVRRLEVAKIAQETLYAELQHRVANNLQLVISLLRRAKRNLRDPVAAADILNDAEGRIFAMSHLHRRLHDGTAFNRGLEPLLREMLANAFCNLPVKLRVEVGEAPELSIDQMNAIALLVNEAAINAAKHVFSQGRGTQFFVSLFMESDGGVRLEIRDDGPGATVETSAESSQSLGMGLMQAFALQLGGSLEVNPGTGMSISVKFASLQVAN